MTEPGQSPRPVIGALTALWIAGLLAVLWWLLGMAFQGWADEAGGRSATAVRAGEGVALLVLVAVAVGGPLLIALVAFRRRRTRLALVLCALAVVLGVVSLPLLATVAHSNPAEGPPSAPQPVTCQEYSGGDTRCPGG